MTAVVVTGIGCLAAPGRGTDPLLAALRSGTCHLAVADDPRLPLAAELAIGRVDADLGDRPRTLGLGLAAAEEALADLASEERADLGLVAATATAGMPESEAAYLSGAADHAVYRAHPAHVLADRLAVELGCGGPRDCHSTACASAACAIAEAVLWLRSGRCRRVLVVGADANTRLTLAGFAALKVIDPAGCRPLCTERAGMSLGEAGAALLLETGEAACERGAAPLARALGWGLRSDGHHATAPHPEGLYLQGALHDALDDAGIEPGEVDYVNAHGTGTRGNDASEAVALNAVFGPAVPVASSKRITGHCMGAAAAVEAVACVLALREGQRFVSAGIDTGSPLPGIAVQDRTESVRLRRVCTTSLAFGGVNAALVFGAAS